MVVHDERDWWELAVCSQTDPEIFFPEPGGKHTAAKLICRSCPVREQCLEYAQRNRLRDGIWGGLSDMERRALRRGAA